MQIDGEVLKLSTSTLKIIKLGKVCLILQISLIYESLYYSQVKYIFKVLNIAVEPFFDEKIVLFFGLLLLPFRLLQG